VIAVSACQVGDWRASSQKAIERKTRRWFFMFHFLLEDDNII
jgi:hypothetical protein